MAVLRVLAAHRPPLCFIEGGENGSQPIFSGYLVDLLPTLLNQAQLQLVYSLTAYVGSGGELQANGTWTGVMGELTGGHTDLALFPLTLTSQRAQYIQSTPPYMDDGYGILVKTRRVDSGYSFLLPFTGLTWAMLLVALVATMLLLTLLDAVTRNARLRAFERVHGAQQHPKKRRDAKIMNHAIESIMMAVGSGAAPTSRSWAVKIVYIAWAVFCVIMLAAYTAILTANMTVSQLGVAYKTLQDLAQSGLPLGVIGDSSIAAYFTNSTGQAARMLRPKMREFTSTAEGAEAVRQGELSAFINDYATVQFVTQEPPCDLALSPETIGSGQLVLGLPRNSTLLQPLSAALLQLSEAGYMAELRRKWFVESSQCGGDDLDADGSGQLHLTHAWSVFLIVAGGAAVGLLAAAGEMLYYRRLYTRRISDGGACGVPEARGIWAIHHTKHQHAVKQERAEQRDRTAKLEVRQVQA
ncbi:hypothetical protein COO60DRAFT_537106 [Scenedesmus sp. NREL 46B-D3]|nr:hypothetical protein COO60DRAFT_537106 [Scenedesmus sp. NREL 46B-D3]